ncbi:hypothetical protein RI367_005992 [Sorochytrium milnesiophthora]
MSSVSSIASASGRSQAQRRWYNGVFPHYPAYSGPYAVGVHDFEWADPNFDRSQMVTDTDTLFVRIFYPCEPDESLHRPHWLGKHEAIGYGDFVKLPRAVSWSLFNTTFAFTRLPAYLNARLAAARPAADGETASPQPPKFPVMVFSHGLGGCKGSYSYFCGDYASRGFVVMAVEHRDRSACISLSRGKEQVTYQRAPVSNLGHDDYAFRNSQVRHRAAEVLKVAELLEHLNSAHPPHNELLRTRPDTEGAADTNMSTTTGPAFTDRLDLANMVACGHSFGGATMLTVLQRPRKSLSGGDGNPAHHPFHCGFVMDPWMFPVDKSQPLTVPVIISSSESFQWQQNIIDTYKVASTHPDSIVFTLSGTGHQNHSDFPLLLPGLLRKGGMSGKSDPLTALRRNNIAGLSFMMRYLDSGVVEMYEDADAVLKYGDKVSDLASLTDDVIVGWKWFDEKYGTRTVTAV